MASLDDFRQDLRPYQSDAVAFALDRVLRDPGPGSRSLFSAPTGSGKGTIEIAILRALRDAGTEALILTPSLDIARGFLQRCGVPAATLDAAGEAKLAAMAETIGVTTPMRYRNQVLQGIRSSAEVFIADEAHHYSENVETFSLLFTLAPEATWLGFTATPFRGTPRGTIDLHAAWGEPWVILDIPEAVHLGCCQMPRMFVEPLVDDDRIEVRNGQFVADAVNKEVAGTKGSRLAELLQLATREARGYGAQGQVAGVPTALVLPSTDTARLAESMAGKEIEGTLPCVFIGQHSTPKDRAKAYALARERQAILTVIHVLGEGVDLPWLRAMVDAAPTLSPVVWAQRVGRIMRPEPEPPRYLCVCRNLERHAYLMQGAIPAAYVAQAQQAFDKPSERAVSRAFGLEALRKFKQVAVPCRNGITAGLWVVYSVDPTDGRTTQYAGIAHPCKPDVLYAHRTNLKKDDGTTDWGKWKKLDQLPADLIGFASVPFRSSCSQPQKDWWAHPQRGARRYGLDPDVADKLTSRQFFVLPILAQLRESLD